MKKSQIKVFEELLADPNFKGKKLLEWVLWRNTSTPKYKVGDSFKVSDRGHSVYGYAVKDFKATITNITCFTTARIWRYELEAYCKCGSKETTVKIYVDENEVGAKCKDNINVLGEAKNDCESAISVRI